MDGRSGFGYVSLSVLQRPWHLACKREAKGVIHECEGMCVHPCRSFYRYREAMEGWNAARQAGTLLNSFNARPGRPLDTRRRVLTEIVQQVQCSAQPPCKLTQGCAPVHNYADARGASNEKG
jgi:hypothetical protein